ncbi:MAG TPA: ADOP family duplicated permease [Vicinamibacterales bacterium]|nr:ADOP family duplicated permease [Vicinamibacterales bacterium]
MFELRQAVRSLVRRPAYAVASIGTLALVIGVNAALFAAINATLFRPIPLKSGERTVSIYLMPPGETDPANRNPLHAIDLVRFRERSRTLTHIAAFTTTERVLGAGDEPVVVTTAPVNAEMLRLSNEPPALGRIFTDEEETRKDRLIVLSYGAWQRRFGADPAVVGRSVRLDGEPYTVIGVMARRFPPKFLDAELWTPLGITTSAPPDQAVTNIVTVGQLADGVSFAQASTEIRDIFRDVSRELPRTHQGWSAGLLTFREWQYGNFRAPLAVLFCAVLVLLLIASCNIASLTLAHVTSRGGELSLRRAIGATRWSVARLVLLEIAVVNAIGAALAVLLGDQLLLALLAIAPATTQVLGEVTMDWRVALFAAGCAVLSSIAAGVVPALNASDVSTAFNTWRSSGSRERQRWRTALLIAQTALCVALLVSGGVLVRAYFRTSNLAVGYEPANLLTAQLQLPPSRYASGPERVAAMERIFDRIAAIPGVTHSGATMNRFTPGFAYLTLVEIEDQPTADGSGHTVQFRRVSASYFETMRIRVRRGRVFARFDSLSTPLAAVISQSFADQYWPGRDPIGRRLKRGTAWMTVVGVVDDVSDVDLLQAPVPTLYAAWTQTANVAFPMGLVLRTAGAPDALAQPLRAAVRAEDPMLALDRIQSMDAFLSASLAPQTFRTTLMLGLAIVGLLLGAIGIAGVTARTIVERMPEFGIRLALGCDGADLWRQVVLHQVRVVLGGTLLGVVLAGVASRLVTSMLPEAAGFDGRVVIAAAGLIVATAVVAAAVPASRVLRLSPLAILRHA